jgi:hypothetical protein
LISLKRNDFIFFISSSYLKRFKDNKDFNQYIKLNRKEFDENKPYHCHRVVFDYYKSLLPDNHEYYLSPFSIKKENNIYGLIFGSNHTLGIEKFLRICWSINPKTGDANFDIDNEKIDYDQPSMFKEDNIPSKIKIFEQELRSKIEKKELKTNRDIYLFTFDKGCLPKHANTVLHDLKEKNIIPDDFKTTSARIHKLEISYFM